MGTRSYISKKNKSGYKTIYCHWDGYPEKPGVGWTLRKYYTYPKKVNELIALGDISSLRQFIGNKHDFDKDHDLASKKGWTTAYHRDRGERWADVKPQTFKNKEDLRDAAKESWAYYLYIFENGKWKTVRL